MAEILESTIENSKEFENAIESLGKEAIGESEDRNQILGKTISKIVQTGNKRIRNGVKYSLFKSKNERIRSF